MMIGTETIEPDDAAGAAVPARRRNSRQCIVTRERDPEEGLIRFVAAPDGTVVPDIRGKLPGRGAHVTARRSLVERAARGHMFSRALKSDVRAPADLAESTGRLLREGVVAMLPMLRKGGDLVVGAGKVEALVRGGEAALVLHAVEAAEDGVRKIAQARHAFERGTGIGVPVDATLTAAELGLAFGGDHVIHAAIRRSGGGLAFTERIARLRAYFDVERGATDARRGGAPPGHSGDPPGSPRD